VQQLSLYMLN